MPQKYNSTLFFLQVHWQRESERARERGRETGRQREGGKRERRFLHTLRVFSSIQASIGPLQHKSACVSIYPLQHTSACVSIQSKIMNHTYQNGSIFLTAELWCISASYWQRTVGRAKCGRLEQRLKQHDHPRPDVRIVDSTRRYL